MLMMCEWASKLHQISIFLYLPQPGMLLPGHLGGVTRYEWYFWTAAGFCNLGQQVELTKKKHFGPMEVPNISDKTHNFEISPTLADLCHMLLSQVNPLFLNTLYTVLFQSKFLSQVACIFGLNLSCLKPWLSKKVLVFNLKFQPIYLARTTMKLKPEPCQKIPDSLWTASPVTD